MSVVVWTPLATHHPRFVPIFTADVQPTSVLGHLKGFYTKQPVVQAVGSTHNWTSCRRTDAGDCAYVAGQACLFHWSFPPNCVQLQLQFHSSALPRLRGRILLSWHINRLLLALFFHLVALPVASCKRGIRPKVNRTLFIAHSPSQ